MNKTAQDQIVNHFYNLGLQAALGNSGMDKTAFVSAAALRRALAGGAEQSAAIGRAGGERLYGIGGTLAGAGAGAGAGAALGGESAILSALLGLGGAGAGAAAGNIVGRNVGAPLGHGLGYLSGLKPFRAVGNVLADPLRRVPGIRG
jgi:hypothetical protein